MAFFRSHLTFHSSLFALLAMTADAQQPTNAKVKTVEKIWEMANKKLRQAKTNGRHKSIIINIIVMAEKQPSV